MILLEFQYTKTNSIVGCGNEGNNLLETHTNPLIFFSYNWNVRLNLSYKRDINEHIDIWNSRRRRMMDYETRITKMQWAVSASYLSRIVNVRICPYCLIVLASLNPTLTNRRYRVSFDLHHAPPQTSLLWGKSRQFFINSVGKYPR